MVSCGSSTAAMASHSSAPTFRNAYLTDLLQLLIDTGTHVDPIMIRGEWREIDTGQDLDRARQLVQSSPGAWP